jgi:glyoxylase-like metal-dependent hydrolase (beta-lactamase superfamily II)
MAEGFFIHQFELGSWQNFIYLVGDKRTRSCAVVDPAWNYEVILEEAARLDVRITDLLCTHSHFDHVNEVEAMLAHTDARVHMLGAEIDFAGFRCENLVRHAPGDRVTLGDVAITMMHTPGHTPGSTCYHVHGVLVTGDTMFVNGCGRCDFVGGDPEVMYRTLHGLTDAMPGSTIMCPGHNYGPTPTSRLDAQLETNPYLKLPTLADFVAHRMAGKTPGTVIPPPAWPPPEGRPRRAGT